MHMLISKQKQEPELVCTVTFLILLDKEFCKPCCRHLFYCSLNIMFSFGPLSKRKILSYSSMCTEQQ